MKVLIIGTGLMGTAFKTAYPAATIVTRSELDITDIQKITTVLDSVAPDIIINCAAYTAVDQAETDQETANLTNGTAVRYLAQYAAKKHCTLVHFSTDYVFDGSGEKPYLETDKPSPINAYGHSKWLGEIAASEHEKTFIFRIQWIYGENGNNFVEAIKKKARLTGHLDVVNDQWGSPTWSQDLAEKIVIFLRLTPNNTMPLPPYGIYHVAAQGHTNWHDFAQEILQQTGIAATLTAIPSGDMPRPAKRPQNGRLNCSKFAQHAPLPLAWTDALAHYLHTAGTPS
jgi:dTDP-4-dehydrorhamnose reductase